jgi:anthranilate synthase component 1
VEKAKNFIKIGDIIQAVPSQRFARKTKADAFDIYRSLRLRKSCKPGTRIFYWRK